MLPFALLACMMLASVARAERHDPLRDRLDGWRSQELRLLGPHLEAGPVALVEFADTDEDELPAINLAVRIAASAPRVAALIADPHGYPRFMRTLDTVKVLGRHGDTVSYAWHWQLGLFELGGKNVMTVYAPPPGRESRGYRIGVDSTEGHMGKGRMLFKVKPEGPKRSLVTLSMRVDLRDANYIMRQLSKASRSINRSANLALCFTMLMGVKAEAEGSDAPARAPGPLAPPEVDLNAVVPLLSRGDLVLMRSQGTRLDQVSVIGRIGRKPEVVRKLMQDADAFGSALLPGSGADVVSRKDGRTVFEWGIGLPLVGVSGTMSLENKSDVLAIDAIEGAFEGGRWRFATPAWGHTTVVIGWARFDLGRSGWLLERLVGTDPYIGQGLSAASQVMLVRALRSRARKYELPATK